MFLNCFSCTRDDRKERIVAAGNSVRQALQELLSEYMENAGTKPTEQLDDAIQVLSTLSNIVHLFTGYRDIHT